MKAETKNAYQICGIKFGMIWTNITDWASNKKIKVKHHI
jgi:hypothetical protein